MDLYKMGAWENDLVKYKKQPEKTTKKKTVLACVSRKLATKNPEKGSFRKYLSPLLSEQSNNNTTTTASAAQASIT